MAFKQNLVQKLFNMYSNKLFSNQTLRSCLISSSSSSSVPSVIPPSNPEKLAHDPGENSIFRRFLQRRPLYLSRTESPLPQILRPGGEKLLETLNEMDIARNRIRLEMEPQFTVADAKKILKISQLETVKLKLKSSQKNHVSYDEFVQICVDGCGNNRDQGVDVANVLDNSGFVIVLGNVVFLKPKQVVKAINGLMPREDFPMKELEGMERWKSEIDNKAEKMVRRELWGGLGYLVVQTAAFMRLTFWELSWDVMEPICFYVTSMYFMLGYAYFLRTSREPSFEAVFKSRFHVKQMKLMKMEGFDVKIYNELKRRMEGSSLEEVYDDGTIN
uniref:calcium uniporter protein 2, mitochondrial-like n=1 Tax=Erigeron canadensis TaxID=72917 RepID=UPI001CB8A30F|nr:calcium uniporter protein 2, mitochondrial-like [Erigeron canadensis]